MHVVYIFINYCYLCFLLCLILSAYVYMLCLHLKRQQQQNKKQTIIKRIYTEHQ